MLLLSEKKSYIRPFRERSSLYLGQEELTVQQCYSKQETRLIVVILLLIYRLRKKIEKYQKLS